MFKLPFVVNSIYLGLIQHEQIKAEISKQDVLSFLLELVHKLTGKAHVSIVEILWSLTFHDESALILRSDPTFLKTIENISRESHDEALKKAADGLVWKLIRGIWSRSYTVPKMR